MFRHGRRRGSSRGGARRKKQWTGGWFAQGRVTLPAEMASNDGHHVSLAWARVPSEAIDPLTGFPIDDDRTLLRTITSVTAQIEENGNGPYVAEFWFGILQWNGIDGNVLPALNEIPLPSDGQNADWVARAGVNVPRVAPINLATLSLTPTSQDNTSDYRSRRKLSSNHGLLLVLDLHMQLAPGGGSNPIQFYSASANWRFLLLEP